MAIRLLRPSQILLILVFGTIMSTVLGVANYYGGVLWLFRNPIIAAFFGAAIGFPSAFVFVKRMDKGRDDDYR